MALSVIPAPLHAYDGNGYFSGSFILTDKTRIFYTPCFEAQALLLAGYLRGSTGFPFVCEAVAEGSGKRAAFSGFTSEQLNKGHICLIRAEGLEREEYQIWADFFSARLDASDPAGMAHAVYTMLQLFPPAIFSPRARVGISWQMPTGQIHDKPRHRWRGIMLDCARHFIPVDELRHMIEVLALHHYNVLQLHLTDDQGWRFEVRAYPELTQAGAVRPGTRLGHKMSAAGVSDCPHSGFYTQDQLRELVEFARVRGIMIVPEIDLPGHCTAAIAALPQLASGKILPEHPETSFGIFRHVIFPSEENMAFVRTVLEEVASVFPAPYIHIGGDEVLHDAWREDPRTESFLSEQGLSDIAQMQPWFTRQLHAIAASLGRRIIGWDEVVTEGLPDDVVVSCWRGESSLERISGHEIIMAPYSHTYFDFYQGADVSAEPLAQGGFTPLEKTYSFEPCANGEIASQVIGVQGQLWTEYMPTAFLRQYMLFPRTCALAEVGWSCATHKSWPDFERRMRVHRQRLAMLGVCHGIHTISEAT